MKNLVFLAVVFSTLLLAGCLQAQEGNAMAKDAQPSDGVMAKEISPTPGEAMQKETTPAATTPPLTATAITSPTTSVEAKENPSTEYSGTVLAGKAAKLIDFNKADFEKAKASNSLVVLYFYANWCPICLAEFPKMQDAFNQLENNNTVGFRVNYKDDQTDSDEEALAREQGVPYQHTKVFLRNGERVLKSPEGWDKQRYLDEISKALEN